MGAWFFLVNQTLRKPATLGAAALTGVSLFHIVNKQRTIRGEFQTGLFVNNAVRAEGPSTFLASDCIRSGRC